MNILLRLSLCMYWQLTGYCVCPFHDGPLPLCMYVGEGPILPAALARHSSSSCIQFSGVLPKLKFQPLYIFNYCMLKQAKFLARQQTRMNYAVHSELNEVKWFIQKKIHTVQSNLQSYIWKEIYAFVWWSHHWFTNYMIESFVRLLKVPQLVEKYDTFHIIWSLFAMFIKLNHRSPSCAR